MARTSHDAACSAACQTVKILFAPREIDQWFGNGMEEENTPTKTFIRVAVPENTCLQCGKLIDNPALRRKLFSGKQKTKTCQSLELLLGDVFLRDNDLGTICRNCSERNETLTKKIFQHFITLQEENSSCKFGALQGIKVVRAGSYHTRPENQANDFEKV